ncbi:MAG TPA: S8 family serine peptidase [Draconibacterium sp.]|nr:S8 family serine peptidase [Draconibacterium sp.]
MRKHIFLFFIIISFNTAAQDFFWVAFTDKNDTRYSLSEPDKYLSERAIERRVKQKIPIDSLDLPVNADYINKVLKVGAEYYHDSKWLNGVTVKATVDSFEYIVMKLPFVKEVQLTKTTVTKSAFQKFDDELVFGNVAFDTSLYGLSVYQTSILNGQFLHNQNYRGQGMQIAVLDAGFFNANIYTAMDSLWTNNQILGTKDFVDPTGDIFSTHYHGMSVLSCMGGNVPGTLIGTATKASYWLIRSEDTNSEFLIEEDNWVAAAEFADSVGVDVINSSLGYYEFDDPRMNHTYADLDGKTTRVTKGANIAASRGILVFSSAGNEGNDPWKYIIAPSDGENILGIGAVDKDSIPAYFSSYGPAFGGKIKPNVAALGLRTVAQKQDGALGYISGTSFSSPVMAGMAACLWQAFPYATAAEVKGAIEWSAHFYKKPDSLMGYGIPDMEKASFFLMNLSSSNHQISKQWTAYPNPFGDVLMLQKKGSRLMNEIVIDLFTIDGKLLKRSIKSDASRIELRDMQSLPTGILILKISSDNFSETIKLSKTR